MQRRFQNPIVNYNNAYLTNQRGTKFGEDPRASYGCRCNQNKYFVALFKFCNNCLAEIIPIDKRTRVDKN